MDVEELPNSVADASAWLREQHPEIEWSGPKERTAEEIERGKQLAERLKGARRVSQEIDFGAIRPSPASSATPRKAK